MATIAVNAAIRARGSSGSARATEQLLNALRQREDWAIEELMPTRPRRKAKLYNALQDARWDLVTAGQSAKALGAALLISSCNIGRAPRHLRHILVVYDAMIFDHPSLFDPAFRRYAQGLIRHSMVNADLVVTISEYSRTRLLGACPASAPVEVLPLFGFGDRRAPSGVPQQKRVLVLGATEPHKKQASAIEAVAFLRKARKEIYLDLVGPVGRDEPRVTATMKHYDPNHAWIRRLIDVPRPEVRRLIDQAWALLQPSLDEGFGLPLIEAAERGIPVVHSGAGAMLEVMPHGAALSPSPRDLAAALEALLERETWFANAWEGYNRARLYSEETFASRSLTLVSKVLAMPGKHERESVESGF